MSEATYPRLRVRIDAAVDALHEPVSLLDVLCTSVMTVAESDAGAVTGCTHVDGWNILPPEAKLDLLLHAYAHLQYTLDEDEELRRMFFAHLETCGAATPIAAGLPGDAIKAALRDHGWKE